MYLTSLHCPIFSSCSFFFSSKPASYMYVIFFFIKINSASSDIGYATSEDLKSSQLVKYFEFQSGKHNSITTTFKYRTNEFILTRKYTCIVVYANSIRHLGILYRFISTEVLRTVFKCIWVSTRIIFM